MAAAIDIVFATGREEPSFDWFADGLARQLGDGDDVRVIVVDAYFSPERGRRFARDARGRFALRHVAPKPTPWQGPHRLTRAEYFAAASARNTGLVHARAPYVVFVDDCSVPLPGWWDGMKRAAAAGEIVTGAYRRALTMRVEAGLLVDARLNEARADARWPYGDDARPRPVAGNHLYTPSMGAPRERLLAINGFDEMCDSIACEDWQLGVRLANAGEAILYDRSMITVECEDRQRAGRPLLRVDPELPADAYMARLAEFGVHRRTVAGRHCCTAMIADIVYGTRSGATHGNYYHLETLTEARLPDTIRRFPARRWFDDVPLAAL
jgi:hypothetical protein